MTNLKNQLRATFYLASRDAYVKAAFVLPALYVGAAVLMALLAPLAPEGNIRILYEDSLPTLTSLSARFGTCLAVLGLAQHDVSALGLRAATVSQGGRAGYVASRMLFALVVDCALALWAVALSAPLLALPVTVLQGTPPAELALAVLAHALTGWAYAAFGLLLVWLAPQSRGFATTLFMAVIVGMGLLDLVLMVPVMVTLPFSQGLAFHIFQATQNLMPGTLLQGATASLARLVPLCAVYVTICWLLAWRRMARASI